MATLLEIAAHFRKHGRRRRRQEVAHYGAQGEVAAIISRAVLSVAANGKRDPHQRRISWRVLNKANRELLSALPIVAKCRDFEALHDVVDRLIRPIDGVGALLVYDTAQRIAIARDIPEPLDVYLHAGTAKGAKALGIRGKKVAIAALPKVLRKFTSFELEDMFCNYAKYLWGDDLPDGPLSHRTVERMS